MSIERSALQALQRRVDQIAATGDDDLAGRAWHALSTVLFEYARERIGRRDVDAIDVRMMLTRMLVNTRANSHGGETS
jgi:hypothetical protein